MVIPSNPRGRLLGRRRPLILPVFLAAQVVLAVPGVAQDSAAAAAAQPKPRICVLGASVSDGFLNPFGRDDGEQDVTARLRSALMAAWPDAEWDDRATQATFMNPMGTQRPLVTAAVEAEPDLVIGLDYAFWFGYGRTVQIDDETEAQARLREQAGGLALLSAYDGPLLLGDYPLIRGADPRMLPSRLIPSKGAVKALNEGLGEWAAAREQTRVLPLAAFFDEVIAKGGLQVPFENEAGKPRQVFMPRDWLMQGDGLHTSRLGIAVLAREIASKVRELLPEGHVARPAEMPFSAYLAAARAKVDFDDMLEFDDRAKVTPIAVEAAGGGEQPGRGKR